MTVAGCARDQITLLDDPAPFLIGPKKYMSNQEIDRIVLEQNLSSGTEDKAVSAQSRNDFISSRMFIIDRYYNDYESGLARENGFANFFGSVTSLGVSTAASTIPAGQTTKILAAVVTGITGTKVAFDRDVLLTQTVQTIQGQMRTDRARQAKLMLSRMACPIAKYPLYLALIDLEAYRQAGTFDSALQSLAKSVASAEEKAQASIQLGALSASESRALKQAAVALSRVGASQIAPCPIP